MLTIREKYYTDPVFHNLVDVLYYQIEQANYTPSELRQAVLLAAILYEEKHVSPKIILREKAVVDFLNLK